MEKIEIEGQTVFFKTSEELSFDEITNKVSFILTSPPYWDLKDYGHKNEIGHESYEEYLGRMNTIWEKCYDIASEDAILCIIVNDRRKKGVLYPIPMDIARGMKKWKFMDYMIWFTPNAMTQNGLYKNKLYDKKTEMILLFSKNDE
jgi:site-specific DNA-methyltransferase (adenine-specific)